MIEVIGIGADGLPALTPAARELLDAAEVVVGGERHLALLEARVEQERRPWPSPMRPALPALLDQLAGRRVVVLASGDPLVSGVASTLIDLVGADGVRVHPAVSSAALARARMGWSAESTDVVTLVGRHLDRLRRDLGPHTRLVVLTHGADAPARIARLLVEEGYAASLLTVLGDLGGAAESRTAGVAATWVEEHPDFAAPWLHLVCVECRPGGSPNVSEQSEQEPSGRPEARPLRSLVPGLPDDAYANDGQLTKRLVRAAALAHLAPQPGDVMWDLGAGAGSVGIEFARQHPRNRVHAVERDPARAARIRANAARLGVPDLVVVEAFSADVVDELPSPDAVFVGGGASVALLDRVWERLRPGGRLVVHGVTVETEVVLHEARPRLGGTMTRIAVEDLEPIGSLTGWRPARAITQWSAVKSHTKEHP